MESYLEDLDIYGDAAAQSTSFVVASHPTTHHHDVSQQPMDRVIEDMLIGALVQTPALDWTQQQTVPSRPTRPDTTTTTTTTTTLMMTTGGCYRRQTDHGGFVSKIPPAWYVCDRCHEPGHYINHCPTNGDPEYNIKKMKRPSGIPKSMLKADPDGYYQLPTGDVAVVQPDEDTFDKEMEGLRPPALHVDLPPELHCPLCKQVMRDAAITRKCCYDTFCDKCIREHIVRSQLTCFCGAKEVLTDDIIPNLTIRELIARLQSTSPPLSTATSSWSSGTSGSNKRKSSSSTTDHNHHSKRQHCFEHEVVDRCDYTSSSMEHQITNYQLMGPPVV